jgi:hypothetical protein
MARPDPESASLPAALAALKEESSNESIVVGLRDGRPMIGLALKRTYRIGSHGGWDPVEPDEQEVIFDDELDYYEAEPPFVSPVAHGCDVFFREATDIVVQGAAYPPGKDARRVTIQFRLGQLKRDITVFGERRLERSASGALAFSEPEPFESMPIRYDRAYGGVDYAAWMDHADLMEKTMPGQPYGRVSPFHYPRNPAGSGFVLSLGPYDLADLMVPNLEYEFDPITPERLALGTPDRWPGAPLPAGMDWVSGGWFPRNAYLGAAKIPIGLDRVAEQIHGWAAADLLAIPYAGLTPDRAPRLEFAQGASPGMVHSRIPVDTIAAGLPVKLVHMHPDQPELRMVLPREWPRARLGLRGPLLTDLVPELSSIVIRPDREEAVLTWCALTERDREYTPQQFAGMATAVSWPRGKGSA